MIEGGTATQTVSCVQMYSGNVSTCLYFLACSQCMHVDILTIHLLPYLFPPLFIQGVLLLVAFRLCPQSNIYWHSVLLKERSVQLKITQQTLQGAQEQNRSYLLLLWERPSGCTRDRSIGPERGLVFLLKLIQLKRK